LEKQTTTGIRAGADLRCGIFRMRGVLAVVETLAMDVETRRHRALADTSRARLLDVLRASERSLSADELAEALRLHPNTVRAHLDVLEEAGLVVASREERTLPGRPRRLFAAVPEEAEREHELLAAALASSLEPLPDGDELAAASGRSWGRVLVERLEPGRDPTAPACIQRVTSMLQRRGFAPEAAGDEIVMRRCPFRELAERYPRVVCSLHAGIIDGALAELHAPLEVERLEPWVTPTMCVAWLRPSDR
jgi:predicted ArsR family transcriptional regulator